ncbi:retropepsin-like aspartic protease family protein [Arhodomonas sp. SL1]|uniref:retropepsin-like aspartic protease family protein n=1 Tax=Arhodomonas sp. SL1 TaxID=3425691 RepID=UPI003F880628
MDEQARGQRRMGWGMMAAFWVLALGMGTWWFQGMVAERYNPNAQLASGEPGEPVVLERNRSGHFVATGHINGEPVQFLVDTGATYVSVPRQIAARLDLEQGRAVTFRTANGRVRGHLTNLESVRLGGLEARDVRGSINPGLDGETALLGMSYLDRFDLEFRDRRMVLHPR